MTDKRDEEISRVFLAEDILPDLSGFFEDEPKGLASEISEANIVLDTNVLLIPYGSGASGLTDIVRIYQTLKDENRLHIPSQVAREFVKNRPNKLAELYQGIADKVSKVVIPANFSYPILESVPEFEALREVISDLTDLKKKSKVASDDVRKAIKEWGWNDPVSKAYRPIFDKSIIKSISFDREAILAEMQKRYQLNVPPGYKDSTKDDQGIGDFLIWKTILSIGEESKKSTIFVSGDEKADWLHGSGGSGFLPRYELQAEYRRKSDGSDLYIIPLSRLLELLHAEDVSVDEVKSEEERIRLATSVEAECPECSHTADYDLSEHVGSSAMPTCNSCGQKFHLHRTQNGVTCHPLNSSTARHRPTPRKEIEIVYCPECDAENLKELGIAPNSTGWCVCDDCETKFPIHRRRDGSAWVNSEYGG